MKDNDVRSMLKRYLQAPFLLSVPVVIGALAAAAVSPRAGIFAGAGAAIYILCACLMYWFMGKRVLNKMIEFADGYNKMQGQLLSSMELPYAMADLNGRILWMNRAFAAVIKEEKGKKRDLTQLFGEITGKMINGMDGRLAVGCSYGGRRYRLLIKRVTVKPGDNLPVYTNDNNIKEKPAGGIEEKPGGATDNEAAGLKGEEFLAAYLYDETEIYEYRQAINDEKMVSGLIYIDNYEEVLESAEEVRRSLLSALIDRKINKYIGASEGIVRKIEKDKYFFVVKQKFMARMEKERFSLLADVKTVNIGNEMSVTLSVGIGMNGESYAQNYEYARNAIDLALGRGGDQVVIKRGDKIQYYGGNTQQMEKNTRVKARVKAHALRELLESKDRLLIMGHSIGDIDAFGASIGMYRIAVALNKKANIVLNNVTSSVRPMKERFTAAAGYPEDLFVTGEEAAALNDANTALVVVDVNRPNYTEAPELLGIVKTIVVIDHHRKSNELITNAALSYVEPNASSACELVAEILQYVADGIRMKAQEADAMYAGIMIDTNNFTNQTGVRTFEAAAFLRRNGADVMRVRKLFRDRMEDYKARAEAVSRAIVYRDAFALTICPSEGVESPTVVGAQAANELLDIVGIKASIVLTEYAGRIYVSARSIDEINVQVMMEKLGGGGHRAMAGAQLTGMSAEEAMEKIKGLIDEMLKEGEI